MTKQKRPKKRPPEFSALSDELYRRYLAGFPVNLQDLHQENMKLLEALKRDLFAKYGKQFKK